MGRVWQTVSEGGSGGDGAGEGQDVAHLDSHLLFNSLSTPSQEEGILFRASSL